MVKGFTQVYGINYSEIYIFILDVDTLRLLLTIITIKNIEAHQIDVNNAFTESVFYNIIYIHSLKGLKVPNGHVLLIVKSLYSLK